MATTSTGRRRNRSWPEALKREIVAASFAAGASVSVVARRYDMNTNQLFSWRKRYGGGVATPLAGGGLAMGPVMVTSRPGIAETASGGCASLIEIELAGGYRVRVDAQVDGAALRRVLDVL